MSGISSGNKLTTSSNVSISPISIKNVPKNIISTNYKKLSKYDFDNDDVVDYRQLGNPFEKIDDYIANNTSPKEILEDIRFYKENFAETKKLGEWNRDDTEILKDIQKFISDKENNAATISSVNQATSVTSNSNEKFAMSSVNNLYSKDNVSDTDSMVTINSDKHDYVDLNNAMAAIDTDDQIKQIDSKIEKLDKQLEEGNAESWRLSSEKQHAIRDGGANRTQKKEAVAKKRKTHNEKYGKIRTQKKELEKEKEARIKELKIAVYASLMDNSDFETCSTAKITEEEAKALTNMMFAISFGNQIIIYNDDFYDYNKLRKHLDEYEMEGWDELLDWDLIKSAYDKGFNMFEVANLNPDLKSGEIPFVYGKDGDKSVTYYANAINYMRPEEIKQANYIYNKYGKDACDEYFSTMQQELNSREGLVRALEFISTINLNDPDAGDYIKTHLKGLWDGNEQFFHGIEVWATGPSEELSPDQYEVMYITTLLSMSNSNVDLGFLGEFNGLEKVYTLSTSEGNILPSMIIGTVGSAMGIEGLGVVTMFFSVAGNSTESAYQEGYDLWRSWFYGLLSGASEAGLEYLLGGIPGVSKLEDKSFFFKLIGEGTEEMLQEMIDPYLKYMATGEEPVIDWNKVLEAGIDGVLLAAYLNGGEAIIGGVVIEAEFLKNNYDVMKELEGQGIEIDYTRLLEDGYIESLKVNSSADSKQFNINAMNDLNYVIQQHDAKYGSGSAYASLKAFMDPTNPHYYDYSVITSDGNARNILQQYSMEQIKAIVSSLYSTSVGYSITYQINNDGHNSFFESFNNGSNYGVKQGFINEEYHWEYRGTKYSQEEISERIKSGEIKSTKEIKKIGTREYFRLKNKLLSQGFTEDSASKMLSGLDSVGACSYADVCNGIFAHYKNNPELFKKIFGYDMYIIDENGRYILNSGELLLDVYTFVNLNENGGSLLYKDANGFIQIDPNALSSEYDPFNRPQLDANNQVYMSDSYFGLHTGLLNQFLKSKNSSLLATDSIIFRGTQGFSTMTDYQMGSIIGTVSTKLNEGKNVSMGIYQDINNPIRLEKLDSNGNVTEVVTTLNWSEGVGHAVYITGLEPRGFLVSSWGSQYLIPYEDIQNGGPAIIYSWDLNLTGGY